MSQMPSVLNLLPLEHLDLSRAPFEFQPYKRQLFPAALFFFALFPTLAKVAHYAVFESPRLFCVAILDSNAMD